MMRAPALATLAEALGNPDPKHFVVTAASVATQRARQHDLDAAMAALAALTAMPDSTAAGPVDQAFSDGTARFDAAQAAAVKALAATQTPQPHTLETSRRHLVPDLQWDDGMALAGLPVQNRASSAEWDTLPPRQAASGHGAGAGSGTAARVHGPQHWPARDTASAAAATSAATHAEHGTRHRPGDDGPTSASVTEPAARTTDHSAATPAPAPAPAVAEGDIPMDFFSAFNSVSAPADASPPAYVACVVVVCVCVCVVPTHLTCICDGAGHWL